MRLETALNETFAALSVRDFRHLWVGTFATQVGMWTQMVAQAWLAYELTGSAVFLAAVAIARAAPSLVLTLPSGVLADRWDRRRIVIGSQFLSMVNSAVLAVLVLSGSIEAWHLVASSFVLGATHSFNMPARQSLVAQLAGYEHMANAVALNAISFNTSRVLGPALAGVLIGVWGLAACFIIQALALMWGMLWTLAISDAGGSPTTTRRVSMWDDLVDGLRYMKGSPAISGLIAIAAVPILVGMVYMQLMPVFARDVLQVGASGMGVLMSAVGAGSMAGAFVSAGISGHPRKGIILIGSTAVFGVAIALFALSSWLPTSVAALGLLGVAQAISMAMNQTLLNLLTPNEYRGRMMSMYMMTWNFEPVVFLPAGWLTDLIGAPPTTVLAAVVVVLSIGIVGARQRAIRDFRDPEARSVFPSEVPSSELRVPSSEFPSSNPELRVPGSAFRVPSSERPASSSQFPVTRRGPVIRLGATNGTGKSEPGTWNTEPETRNPDSGR